MFSLYIIDTRLDETLGIKIDCIDKICASDILDWVTPFFTLVTSRSVIKVASVKCANLVDDKEYTYENGIFSLNSNLCKNKLLYNVMSISRLIFKIIASSKGFLNLHALCITHKNKGILFNADRNGGKTTVMLKALRTKKFCLLANDQIMYSCNDRVGLGYPATIAFRRSSYEELDKRINENALWYVDDCFQTNKPVIHISKLVEYVDNDIINKSEIFIFVDYKKSQNPETLLFSDHGNLNVNMVELLLPFRKAYIGIFDSCLDAVARYYETTNIQQYCVDDCRPSQTTLRYIDVECGYNKIDEMLHMLMALLK